MMMVHGVVTSTTTYDWATDGMVDMRWGMVQIRWVVRVVEMTMTATCILSRITKEE